MKQKNLEAVLKDVINKGDEYDKVDLKSTYDISKKKNTIRLIKCIASIANSYSTYFDNIGYIILGAKRGKLVGGFTYLEKDSFSSNLQVTVNDYLDPTVKFSVERFKDSKLGWWGVIIIPYSSETHVFRKEYQDLKIRRGDVYVRHGDSISLAERADHERLQIRKSKGDIKRLENNIKNLEKIIKKSTSVKPELKLYISDTKNNLLDTLEVSPVIIKKTEEEYRADVEKNEEIIEIKNDIKNLEDTIENFEERNLKNQKLPSSIIPTREPERKIMKPFKKELSNYLKNRIQHIISFNKYLDLNARVISLRFCLWNEGNALAEGIKLYIYFPKDIKLSNKNDFLKEPEFKFKKPEDPRIPVPSVLTKLLRSSIDPYSFPTFKPDIFTKNSHEGPSIVEIENSIQVDFWIDKLLQNHQLFYDPIFIFCPEDNLDLKLIYSIYAENVPGLSEGKLIIKIRPKKS